MGCKDNEAVARVNRGDLQLCLMKWGRTAKSKQFYFGECTRGLGPRGANRFGSRG